MDFVATGAVVVEFAICSCFATVILGVEGDAVSKWYLRAIGSEQGPVLSSCLGTKIVVPCGAMKRLLIMQN
jgi:uncharacterized membrane protein YeaQ/YmgE (transglycosylase-associated protein family)